MGWRICREGVSSRVQRGSGKADKAAPEILIPGLRVPAAEVPSLIMRLIIDAVVGFFPFAIIYFKVKLTPGAMHQLSAIELFTFFIPKHSHNSLFPVENYSGME